MNDVKKIITIEDFKKLSTVDGYIDFIGKNCEDPCEGWDGISRRCQCGNRGVAWFLSDDGSLLCAEAF